jgi:hypothetical protein
LSQTGFGRDLVIGQKTGPRIRTDYPRSLHFQQQPDQWPKKAPPPEGIGVVDDQVTLSSELRGSKLDLLRVRQNVLMAEGLKTLCDRLGALTGRLDSPDNPDAHRKGI